MKENKMENSELKVIKIEDEENAYSLILPSSTTYTMTLSGWLYSRYTNQHFNNTSVWVSINGKFELFEQFSLSHLGAVPHLISRGENAFAALQTIREAYLSFNANDFDSDGYYIKNN